MKSRWAMSGVGALLLTACVAVPGPGPMPGPGQVGIQFPVPGIVIDPVDPYYYTPSYCVGCWYGQWGARTGYHRGGGRPWERAHSEADHHGHDHGSDVRHDGHR
jgi:hypothetical protein